LSTDLFFSLVIESITIHANVMSYFSIMYYIVSLTMTTVFSFLNVSRGLNYITSKRAIK
jgi:hypothetical protein